MVGKNPETISAAGKPRVPDVACGACGRSPSAWRQRWVVGKTSPAYEGSRRANVGTLVPVHVPHPRPGQQSPDTAGHLRATPGSRTAVVTYRRRRLGRGSGLRPNRTFLAITHDRVLGKTH